MAVRVVGYAADGGVDVLHEEMGHGGAVAFADVRFGRTPAGSVDLDYLVVPCPVAGCGAVSVHPCSGGASPGRVQLLFLRTVRRRRAALGLPVAVGTFAGARAWLRARVAAQDGPDRFRLDALAGEDEFVDD